MLEHNNATYLYLIEVDEEEELIETNQLIARRVTTNGEDAVETVTDEKERQEVARLFFDLFKKMADEFVEEDSTDAAA